MNVFASFKKIEEEPEPPTSKPTDVKPQSWVPIVEPVAEVESEPAPEPEPLTCEAYASSRSGDVLITFNQPVVVPAYL